MIDARSLIQTIEANCPVFDKVYWYDKRGDEFKGIDDTKGSYAYLRYSTDKVDTFDIQNWDDLGCGGKEISANMVLVAHFDTCKNKEAVAQMLCKVIDGFHKTLITSAGIDTELIYQSETGKDMVDHTFDLIKISFVLTTQTDFRCQKTICKEDICC